VTSPQQKALVVCSAQLHARRAQQGRRTGREEALISRMGAQSATFFFFPFRVEQTKHPAASVGCLVSRRASAQIAISPFLQIPLFVPPACPLFLSFSPSLLPAGSQDSSLRTSSVTCRRRVLPPGRSSRCGVADKNDDERANIAQLRSPEDAFARCIREDTLSSV